MAKGSGSGAAWAALIIALIALGLSGYMFYTTTLKPTPKASVYIYGGSYSATAGSQEKVNFNKALYDSHGAFDFTTDEYTVPENGYYSIIGTVTATFLDYGQILYSMIFVNTTYFKSRSSSHVYGSSVSLTVTASCVVWLEAGWTVHLNYLITGTGSQSIQAGEGLTYLTIVKIE